MLVLAQNKPAGTGHWEGSIQTPDGNSMDFSVDLDQNAKNEWIGDIDIPARNTKDAPLAKITASGTKLTFGFGAGGPTFAGEVAADGKSIKGELTVGDNSMPFALKWVSEPKVVLPVASPPVAKEFEGFWEGEIAGPDGNTLRVQLKLANTPEGANGVFISVDQGGAEIPINNIKQEGAKLSFELKVAGGTYTGELKEGAIAGTWTQGMYSAPLVFKKK
jgi:hypothetical protein